MGSFNFKWTHPAEEVYVTGTFDNWSKSTKLNKLGTIHERSVAFPNTDEKILYKFVADGEWRIDPTHKIEKDHEGNENNVLYVDDIEHHSSSTGILSSVAPGASTLAMAGAQPKSSSPPGAFPETPSTEEDKQLSVNPIPATGGIGNPVQLPPGEKVPDPSTLTDNTVDSTVKTDKASYENSSAGAAENLTGSFGRPPSSSHVIPESGLPMGNEKSDLTADPTDPTVSSVGPSSTTAGLAGQVPKEPRGTATVVSDSQDEDKSSSGIYAKAAAGAGAAGVAVAGAAVAANELIKSKTGTDPAASLPTSVQHTINQNAADSSLPQQAGVSVPERGTADGVPSEVSESQKAAHYDPEASANAEAVKEKSAAEKELLSKVPESEAKGEPAPTATASTSAAAPAATSAATAAVATTTSSSGAPQIGDPTAGVEPIKLDEKPTEGLKAPAEPAAKPPGTDAANLAKVETPPAAIAGVASSSAPGKNGPSTSTPQKRLSLADRIKGTPSSDKTPSSPSDSKKEKRRSFFGRIKDKFKENS